MAKVVIMPRQGQSVESCVITAWNKRVGDKISAGDILFSYETDKSAFDEVSEIEGTMLAILAEDGEDVPCLQNVCVIGDVGEDISEFTATATVPAVSEKKTPVEVETKVEVEVEVEAKANIATFEFAGKPKISPRAKALAIKTGADLSSVIPTGPDGRIIERDINALLDAGKTASAETIAAFLTGEFKFVQTAVVPAESSSVAEIKGVNVEVNATKNTVHTTSYTDYREVKLSSVRRVIAKAMHASLSEMAQLTLNSSFDASEIMAYRNSLKNGAEAIGLANITINDMILFAVSRILPNHADLNAHLVGDNMRYFSHVNLGVAVDTDRGLLVPTIFGADTMSLNTLSLSTKNTIGEAKSGKISPDNLQGGTFTVTNLGSLGIESFTPVINPPQTAILGVDCITHRVKEDGSVYPAMGLSLTFDHRAVDGAPAAKFLNELCRALEKFSLLLAK